MSEYVRIESTSRDSAKTNDIILKQTGTTRLLFRPEIINNIHDSKASIKGVFIYQRKSIKGEWEDYKDFKLSNVKAGEWISLPIKSSELSILIAELKHLYNIYEKHGIELGSHIYKKDDYESDESKAVEVLSGDPELIKVVLDKDKGEIIANAMKWLAKKEDPKEIISNLQKFEENELDKLHNLISITNIQKLIQEWSENKLEQTERYWQELFVNNKWILSQIFPTPELFLYDEAYIGGKGLSNRDGKMIDFLYSHSFTKDITLIEIKTPTTPLLSSEYRNNVFSIHPDLSGAIGQILSYKLQIQKDYHRIKSESGKELNLFNPQCVVIAGNLSSLDNQNKVQSFELFRKELKGVSIITFDELFKKIELLMNLLDGGI